MSSRTLPTLLLASLTSFVLAACGGESETQVQSHGSTQAHKKELVLGFGVGNYIDQVKYGVVPLLEKKGYKITLRQFTQGNQLNPAVDEGMVDASVFQTRAFMESYNEKMKSNIVAIADNPSPPQSLRSKKHPSLDAVKDGAIVVLANDPVNGERGARILEKLGWIKLKDHVNPLQFSLNDVLPGKYKLDLRLADSAQGMRLLDDVDFAVINGNFVINSGEKVADGLVVEDTPLKHRVALTLKADNKDTQYAKDLIEAFESKEYADYIRSEPKYAEFIEPAAWQKYPR